MCVTAERIPNLILYLRDIATVPVENSINPQLCYRAESYPGVWYGSGVIRGDFLFLDIFFEFPGFLAPQRKPYKRISYRGSYDNLHVIKKGVFGVRSTLHMSVRTSASKLRSQAAKVLAMLRRRPLHPEDVDNVSGYEPEKSEEEADGKATSWREGPKNPLAWLAAPWHFSMAVFYALLLYYGMSLFTEENVALLDPKGTIPAFGGRLKFLTHINQWVQLFFFTLQFLTDLLPVCWRRRCQKVLDVIFTTIVFPLAATVAICFWGLYAIDRNLVYPERYDLFVPQYINHFWHTTVLLWVLCEMYLFYHHFPTMAISAVFVFLFGTAYIAWVVYIKFLTDWWCYPFMKLLPPYALALFFAASLFLNLGLFVVGRMVSKLRWGTVTYVESLL